MALYKQQLSLGVLVVNRGKPVLLSTNCGSLHGTAETTGRAFRSILFQSDPDNKGNVYLLPRGMTFADSPGELLGVIFPGESTTDLLKAGSVMPEEYSLDSDEDGQIIYGVGYFGG